MKQAMPDWLDVDQTGIGYEGAEVMIVDGIRCSRELFKHFSDAANQGRIFRLVKAGGKTITIAAIAICGAQTDRFVCGLEPGHPDEHKNFHSSGGILGWVGFRPPTATSGGG